MNLDTLSVVIAVQNAELNLPEILRNLRCADHPDVEFLVCHTDADPGVPRIAPDLPNVRVLRAGPGSLIPHMWRDGILAAEHAKVATTTAHCIPDREWVDRLQQAPLQDIVGLGGAIENAPDADTKGIAIFLLRYLAFAPPQNARRVQEIAADNAVYRRADVVAEKDLLRNGFWEPSFHARFREAGLSLAVDPQLRVLHRNRYRARQFLAQRFAHGREFGRARAIRLPWLKRVALAALSPLLPAVFLRKIVVAAWRSPSYRRPLAVAFPWLCLFLLGWGCGEARGYLESLLPE